MLWVLLTISTDYSQSLQRLTEWHNTIGSNGLAVVGNFMDSFFLETTEEQQEIADYLLHEHRYNYLKMRDTVESGEPVVHKATISIPAYALKVIQVKQGGRYQGHLVIQTMVQCWVDFEGAVDVLGFVDHSYFPYTALILSATLVCFPLCMTLSIFMMYRCIMLSGCGPMGTSPRRAMIMQG